MAAGHDGMPLARRTAIGLAALTIAALSGVLLPTGARAGVVPLAVVTDKRSHDPHSHGPSPTHTPTERRPCARIASETSLKSWSPPMT